MRRGRPSRAQRRTRPADPTPGNPNESVPTIAAKLNVVVIGGGVFGACAAYRLARTGARVTLVERDEPGQHASARNPGNLNPILANKTELIPLALESLQLHRALADELRGAGLQYALGPVRRVLVAFDDQDRAELEETERLFARYPGFPTQRLGRRALREVEPRLSDLIVEGLQIDGNESLDSAGFNAALVEGARKAGAKILRATAQSIDSAGHGVSAVETDRGRIECDILVLATGPWVAEVAEWLGFELVVEPVKGELLRMRLGPPTIARDFTHGLISLYRRGADEVWVGVTRERCGFDETPTAGARKALLEGAARLLPAIREAVVREHVASLRPMTATGLPIVGRIPGWDNVLVANGGGIKGVLLSAGIGTAICDLAVAGTTALPVQNLAPRELR
jgi:glycine/D-amino acid oxidase-like deaminating enzyme